MVKSVLSLQQIYNTMMHISLWDFSISGMVLMVEHMVGSTQQHLDTVMVVATPKITMQGVVTTMLVNPMPGHA